MRITYAVPRYLPHLGGIENHVAALATGSASAGDEVTVLTQEPHPASARDLIDGVEVRRAGSVLGVRGQGVSPGQWRAVHRRPYPDLLHAHNVHAASTLGVLWAAPRGRLVVTPHYLGPGTTAVDRAMHAVYDPWLARALRRATVVICVSSAEADALEHDLGVRRSSIRVIPNGVDVELLRGAAPLEVDRPVILAAGRLEPYKRVDAVIEALVGLPDHRLVVAGAGPGLPDLIRLADDRGVTNRTSFIGRQSPGELARWYRTAETVVSMSGRECFGLTLAEGLAAGAAVVASDIPPHREVIRESGGDVGSLVPVGAAPRELAAALLAAPGRRPSRPPRPASWADVVSRTRQLYTEVAS